MEENSNMYQNNQNEPKKKKMPKLLKIILVTLVCLIVVLGGGNIYASTQGYDNIFFLIKHVMIGEEVRGKENILSDKDITISYRPIEIAKGTQIQINSLVIKDDEAKLKIQVNELNAEESITPLKYVVKDEEGTELCSYVSKNAKSINNELQYKEELKLKEYKEENEKLVLEIYNANNEKIVNLEIDLANKEINVIGNAKEATKISEEELKKYLSSFIISSYDTKETNDVSSEEVDIEITDIYYINGIYNVTFKFCYLTEANKEIENINDMENLPVYEMSIGLILDESDEESKYKASIIQDAVLVEEEETEQEEIVGEVEKNELTSDLDISFLKLENEKENKIYSPLSIKYALKMLEDGTNGESRLQISNLIGKYNLTKYKSNSNMSLANSLFIRDTFNDMIKQKYINTLRTKYNAEIVVDSFADANNVNSWVSNKTLNLINNLLNEIEEDQKFLLINALGIDMEWKDKFLTPGGEGCSYEHERFSWRSAEQVSHHEFGEEEQIVSGMEIAASINNYDIITELGEGNIRKTVGDEFRKWAKNLTENDWEYNEIFDGDLSDEKIEEKLAQYLDGGKYYGTYDSKGYISEINSNYKRVDYSTDFSLYVDDSVKVFAKDLKEYDGTTLQYIGIMPTNQDLDSYVQNVDQITINNIISNLKELKAENFKEGVVTKITGYIPKFKFEYELKLKEDLEKLGIKDVFEQGKANLVEICEDEDIFINDAVHKANIEFTQDGIKAAAATMMGGAGAGSSFDYIYDIPVEEIDLTFDKPYMFLIRDKETGEIWFMGTVYEPLSWEEEPENNNVY